MATLDSLQKKKEEVDKIINDISLKSKTIEERVVQVNTFLTSVKTTDKEYQNLIQKLQQVQKTANENVENFKIEKNRINKLYSDIQQFYNLKFLPLSRKIENTETGFVAKIKQVNTTSNSINSIYKSCKSQLEKIENYANRYTKALKSLESLDKSIRKIYANIDSANTKSNEFLNNIQEAKRNSVTFAKEISGLQKDSKIQEEKIRNLLNSATEHYDQITLIKEKSDATLREIFDIYEIAADTGRSGEFDKRRKAVTLDLLKWEKYVLWSTVVLFTVIIGLFAWQLYLYDGNLKELTMDISFYLRLLFTSPIIYYITFASLQYNRAKKLVDIYSYKTTMAMSIKSHLELLTTNENFKHFDKEILQFTLESFEKIYKEPYDNSDDLKMKLKLMNVELGIEKTKNKEFKEVFIKKEKEI